MANVNTITDLALNLLRGPMNPNPTTARDKLIAELQIRYRTFYVEFDINQILPYEDFGERALDKTTTTLNLVDDCGNKWNCVLIYGSFPYKHFKIGGEWKRLVAARRLEVGDHITVGGYVREKNEDLYLLICR